MTSMNYIHYKGIIMKIYLDLYFISIFLLKLFNNLP